MVENALTTSEKLALIEKEVAERRRLIVAEYPEATAEVAAGFKLQMGLEIYLLEAAKRGILATIAGQN